MCLSSTERLRIRGELLARCTAPHVLTPQEHGDIAASLRSFVNEFPRRRVAASPAFDVWRGGNLLGHLQPFFLAPTSADQ
jgi:hypothetical protein